MICDFFDKTIGKSEKNTEIGESAHTEVNFQFVTQLNAQCLRK